MSDIVIFLQWYFVLFLIGTIFIPITRLIFSSLEDKGYLFSKVFAILTITYFIFVLGTIKILPFTALSLLLIVILSLVINGVVLKKIKTTKLSSGTLFLWAAEELLFFLALAVWMYIRGHEPSINGLEKFMDYGFINSILRSAYFPPLDMWFPPHSINYYYFGHLYTAVLTKLSNIGSNYTYNLMVATLFALTLGASFSIGYNIAKNLKLSLRKCVVTAFLAALLVSSAGNLHILYSFFSAYVPAENPVPLWKLAFQPLELFSNGYWYPNATRFIPNTIHEFPLYSFVVSDLHGHVLDIPIVLTYCMVLFTLIKSKTVPLLKLPLLGFLLSVMYMTNVLDFGIYTILTLAVFGYLFIIHVMKKSKSNKNKDTTHTFVMSQAFSHGIKPVLITLTSAFAFTLPFSIHFKPFASGIGILCSPDFLTAKGAIGPFLFEPNHCQRSEWWMLLTLYGFFYFFVIILFAYLWKNKKLRHLPAYAFCVILALVSTLLIIIPEFAYIKDIYPGHYRANTMFKLTYQAFIMLSILSSVVAISVIKPSKNFFLTFVTFLLIALVLLYPRFAVYSYYNNLDEYQGIDGTQYLEDRYPSDYEAIQWLNKNINGQPVILESQGDSYTDHARISSNTGLPTVLGWTVHEWLWRGSYDIPAPRITDVQTLYESPSIQTTRELIDKHAVEYVYIGDMERETYPLLDESKFQTLGNIVYENEKVTIYRIN